MHFISENTHRGLLWNSDDLHNINTHLLCERSVTWSLFSLSGCFSIPGGKTIRRLKRRLETIFSSRGACILNLQGWAFPGLFLFVQFIKETGLRGSMWDGRMFNTTWMNEVGQWWLRPPAPLQYQFRIKFLIKEAHRQIEEFQEYPDVARKQEQTCRPISCLKGLQEPSQSCQSYPKASSLIWWHFWHMWLQLSPELPKDILRAKHPCKRPPTSKLPMKSYTSQQWRGMDLLRCDWGPMPSSFRTVSERHPCNATGSPALPPGAQATIHRGLMLQEETGGLLCRLRLFGVLLGVFPTMEHSHCFAAQTKKQWSEGFHKQAPHHPTNLCLWQAP